MQNSECEGQKWQTAERAPSRRRSKDCVWMPRAHQRAGVGGHAGTERRCGLRIVCGLRTHAKST